MIMNDLQLELLGRLRELDRCDDWLASGEVAFDWHGVQERRVDIASRFLSSEDSDAVFAHHYDGVASL